MSSQTDSTERSWTDGTATLRAMGLGKVYSSGKETVRAVDDVSFEITEREFVSIIGPSGSGKSTILRMIAGFEEPTEGQVVLDGIDITDWAPFDRDTNMMFQDLALFPNYTVRENIEYGPKQDGVPKAERRSMAEEMLKVVRLEGYGDRAIDELSGGEQQRVALARCMVNNPSVVLFDEPLASLDRQLRRKMTAELRDIQNRTGSTFLYVTHNQQVALSASDRVIVLNEGKIEQVGTPDDLYNSPATEFVANFVGDMNMFTADVYRGDDSVAGIPIETEPIPVPPGRSERVDPNETRMKVGVRPHSTNVSMTATDAPECYIDGVVKGTVFEGEQNVVSVQTELGTFDAETTASPNQGATALVYFSRDDLHVYPLEEATESEH